MLPVAERRFDRRWSRRGKRRRALFSAEDIMDIAVQIEKNGERFYRNACAVAADSSLKELLAWLADEEVRHREYFMEMKKAADFKKDAPWAAEMSRALLDSAIADRAFSLQEVDFSSIHDRAALIAVAVTFEEDSITFYEILRGFVTDPDIFKVVDAVRDEEFDHIRLLERKLHEPSET